MQILEVYTKSPLPYLGLKELANKFGSVKIGKRNQYLVYLTKKWSKDGALELLHLMNTLPNVKAAVFITPEF